MMNFPIKALGELAPTVEAISNAYGMNQSTVSLDILNAVSMATCFYYKLKSNNGTAYPCMYSLAISRTGKAKTPISKLAFAPHQKYIQQERKKFGKEMSLRSQLSKKEKESVSPIVNPNYIYSTGTIEGIIDRLSNAFPLGVWKNDEASSVFDSWSFKSAQKGNTYAFLCALWSSSSAYHITRTNGSFESSDRPFNIALSIQVDKGYSFIADDVAIDSGMIARFLIDVDNNPLSDLPPDDTEILTNVAVSAYHAKMFELLDKQPNIYLGFGGGVGIGNSPKFTPDDAHLGLQELPCLSIADNAYFKRFTDDYWQISNDAEQAKNKAKAAYFLKAREHLYRLAAWLHFWHEPKNPSISNTWITNANALVLYFAQVHESIEEIQNQIDDSIEGKLAPKIAKALMKEKYRTGKFKNGVYFSMLKQLVRGLDQLRPNQIFNLNDRLAEHGILTKNIKENEKAKALYYYDPNAARGD